MYLCVYIYISISCVIYVYTYIHMSTYMYAYICSLSLYIYTYVHVYRMHFCTFAYLTIFVYLGIDDKGQGTGSRDASPALRPLCWSHHVSLNPQGQAKVAESETEAPSSNPPFLPKSGVRRVASGFWDSQAWNPQKFPDLQVIVAGITLKLQILSRRVLQCPALVACDFRRATSTDQGRFPLFCCGRGQPDYRHPVRH